MGYHSPRLQLRCLCPAPLLAHQPVHRNLCARGLGNTPTSHLHRLLSTIMEEKLVLLVALLSKQQRRWLDTTQPCTGYNSKGEKKGTGHVAGGVSEQTGQKQLFILIRRTAHPSCCMGTTWRSPNRFAQRRRQVPGTISQIFPSGHK